MSKRSDQLQHVVATAILNHAGPAGPGNLHTRALDAVAQLRQQCEESERQWVIAARFKQPPISWAQLAGPLGVTKQALQKKHQAAVDQAMTDEVHGFKYWWRYDNGLCACCRRPMAHPENTREDDQPHRKRQHRLTNGAVVHVCKTCKSDPARLLTIETEPLV
ncbi:MAG: hypothetical protein QM804_15685 [Propionicimonas sp.]